MVKKLSSANRCCDLISEADSMFGCEVGLFNSTVLLIGLQCQGEIGRAKIYSMVLIREFLFLSCDGE